MAGGRRFGSAGLAGWAGAAAAVDFSVDGCT